jgi:hypothetical protein
MVTLKVNQVTQRESNGELLGIWYCLSGVIRAGNFSTSQQVCICSTSSITEIHVDRDGTQKVGSNSNTSHSCLGASTLNCGQDTRYHV